MDLVRYTDLVFIRSKCMYVCKYELSSMYTMYVWHIQHIAAQLSNRNNLKILRVYVCAYLFPGGYFAAHPRGWNGRAGEGEGHLDRSVGIFSSPRNLSSGQHSRARRVRMEANGRGKGVEVAVCIYGAVVW